MAILSQLSMCLLHSDGSVVQRVTGHRSMELKYSYCYEEPLICCHLGK